MALQETYPNSTGKTNEVLTLLHITDYPLYPSSVSLTGPNDYLWFTWITRYYCTDLFHFFSHSCFTRYYSLNCNTTGSSRQPQDVVGLSTRELMALTCDSHHSGSDTAAKEQLNQELYTLKSTFSFFYIGYISIAPKDFPYQINPWH